MLPYFTSNLKFVGRGRNVFLCVALASLVLGATFTTNADAQDTFKNHKSSLDTSRYEAVGRLMVNGQFTCSATLISEKLILTAAHCLVNDDNMPYPVDAFEFQMGFRISSAQAYRKMRRMAIHPKFDITKEMSKVVRFDLGLLEMNHRVSPFKATPLGLRRIKAGEQELQIASYSQTDMENPRLQTQCEVMKSDHSLIVLSCPADHGASGAPMLSIDTTPEIVGVLLGKGKINDQIVSMGLDATQDIEMLKNSLSRFIDGSTFRQ